MILQFTMALSECYPIIGQEHLCKIGRYSMRYHITLIKMATIKNQKLTSADKNVEKLEPLYTVGETVK
jgi:hypothetical protein